VELNPGREKHAPIIQPNKYEHLRRIAFRLGRDIRTLSVKLANEQLDGDRIANQKDALRLALEYMRQIHPEHQVPYQRDPSRKEISLQKMARDIINVAPELVLDAGIDLRNRTSKDLTEKEAAKIIQLQLIEESNNNWEPRFPENEHVWDWVDLRPEPMQVVNVGRRQLQAPKQFFSLRKWPPGCQSQQTQIQLSQDALAEEAQKNQGGQAGEQINFVAGTGKSLMKTAKGQAHVPADRNHQFVSDPKRERWTGRGGQPYFPFGETPYQEKFQSWKIQQDLADGKFIHMIFHFCILTVSQCQSFKYTRSRNHAGACLILSKRSR
jgi:hypothetical protein